MLRSIGRRALPADPVTDLSGQFTGCGGPLVDVPAVVMPQGLALGTALTDGFGAAAAVAEAEGVAPPPMLHGLGFEVAVALAAAPGVLALGPQPPSMAARADTTSKMIGFLMLGFLQTGTCTTSHKAFANRLADCRSRDSL